jgi:hypothetical protein
MGDSASSVSTSELEDGQHQGGQDLRDVLHTKDTHGRIKNCRQDKDRVCEHRNERDHDFHGPYYNQSTRRRSPMGGRDVGGIKPFSRDLRVR